MLEPMHEPRSARRGIMRGKEELWLTSLGVKGYPTSSALFFPPSPGALNSRMIIPIQPCFNRSRDGEAYTCSSGKPSYIATRDAMTCERWMRILCTSSKLRYYEFLSQSI